MFDITICISATGLSKLNAPALDKLLSDTRHHSENKYITLQSFGN